MELGSRRARWVAFGAAVVWSAVVLFPLYWLAIMSLKTPEAVFGGATFLPGVDFHPTLEAWADAFSAQSAVPRTLANSALVSLGSATASTAVGALAGYGLSRYRYRFGFMRNTDIAFWMLSQKIIPPVAVVLPLFLMFNALRLIDSRVGLGILYTMANVPIAAWLMYQYFRQIPTDIEDSARLDGASDLRVFASIAFPLARPGVVATFVVTLVFAWNEFLFALIFTFSRARTMPILVAGQATQHGPQWWDIAVMSLITVAPLVLITALLGKRLMGGLLAGWSD